MKIWLLDKQLLKEIIKMTFIFQVICSGKVNIWLVQIIFSLTRRDFLEKKLHIHQSHVHTHLEMVAIMQEKISGLLMENGIEVLII